MTVRFDDRIGAVISLLLVAMIPLALVMLLFKDVPTNTRDIVMVLVGAIVANATQAVQHRFGSTPSSQRKDDTINTLATTASSAQAALAPVPGASVYGLQYGADKVVEVEPNEAVTVKGTEATDAHV